jgi:signal peptidase I
MSLGDTRYMKTIFSAFAFVWETLKIVVLALLIVIPIRYFLFQPFFVRGQSMEPNFENGDYLIIDELSYRFEEPKRGEVVVFRYPYNRSQTYIKRIIGLPGEMIEIQDNKVIIYSEGRAEVLDEIAYLSPDAQTTGEIRIRLDENEYFVLGDNRALSSDSRKWGPLKRGDIIGKVFIRAWPLKALAKIEAPVY